ncbi:hypothetical protein [Lunatimonas salinarum]|uniref:hypothetical protein n=1 Tax=Lunatimonas salinarum TaxID=1774590 RepID=UPI001AE0E30A|nr:hypothetical protein [Lunatimonas salinarum]
MPRIMPKDFGNPASFTFQANYLKEIKPAYRTGRHPDKTGQDVPFEKSIIDT